MQISQAITTQPPIAGFANTRMPAMISITPTTILNVCAEKGSIDTMPGFRYISQFTSRSVNLSNPATTGTTEKVIFNTIHTDLTSWFEFVVSIVYFFSYVIVADKIFLR